ncbi:Zinc finger protein 142 [Liparis tanakae]|uniref:Zinc finger protein 142 n=1 Tax=Liparis tanakae TaxID=230148 RepID=A0A4Z2HSC1_9TELE|nr:Zinc finger protein 142 [Liparis tanakae]
MHPFIETETAAAACADGSKRPQASEGRPKRKLIPKPALASPLTEGGSEVPRQKRAMKRVRKAAERDKPLAGGGAASPPSKEYLAEGSEHTYRTHACPKCRRCFTMRAHLQEHLHLHFPNPGLQCPDCERFFTSKSKLRVHRLREAGDKVHRCHLCDYSAVERNAIRRHLAGVHADEDGAPPVRGYPCPACGESFRQSRSLKAHMKTHNVPADGEPAACFQEGCSFRSALRKELLRHAAEAHGVEAAECRHHACGAVFRSKTDMEAHRRTHLPYHCPQCEFSCSNKTVFLRHQRHGHPGSDELRCDFCSFATFNPVEFERHVGRLHANEKIHRCPQCSYVTSHKRGLKRHKLMHSGEKPHKCSLCDFRCRDESYLSKHMLTHSDDKNFMCAECGYVTKWKHYLNVHMRKHAGDLRYRCDQCPYRCHRMDQLNSHKLRHQAKSLMCEICAYACKRKYELRNHMLAKHCGEEKPPSVFKCKYCTYTTRYRQALQNHENCKHTKLKEFRCALCFYSSFSSISLFLHKRKAHGYVPGDKAWLENYAAKEKERNSTEFLQDFYEKPSAGHEPSEPSTSEGPPPSQCGPPGLADLGAGKGSVAGPQTVDSVATFDTVNEGVSDSPPSVNSPEEYCTLVLTTLSTTDYQTSSPQSPAEHCTDRAPSTANLNLNGFDISQEKADSSSSEEDPVAVAEAERDQSDLDRNLLPPRNTSQPVEPRERRTSEVEKDAGSIGSTPPPEENKKPLESEIRLKAMKKHDKDQADAMVLEGRVQMLVVPTKDVHRCDACSYVTSKESALRRHCQALCRGRTTGHKCQDCGAQFKQRRGLDSHLVKKCPALPRKKTKASVGFSDTAEGDSTGGQKGSEGVDEAANAHRTELLNRSSTGSNDPEFRQQEEEQPSKVLTKVRLAKEQEFSKSKQESLYAEKEGKFHCKLCKFSSGRRTTVERHLSHCRKVSRKGGGRIAPEAEEESEELVEEHSDGTGRNPEKRQGVCAFEHSQKRALDGHEESGGQNKKEVSRAERLRCQLCSFTCTQDRRLALHVALKHKGARPHRCRHCPFSTARRYRLEEHESLHTGVGRHGCDACGKSFGAAAKLRQHEARVHAKRPTHFCPRCDFAGYAADDVRRHDARCHAGEQRHACACCDAAFGSEAALRNHRRRAHRPQVRFSCERCDYSCGGEVSLKAHRESEHPRDQCDTCRESFATKEGLEIHRRTHLPHLCRLCPFGTKTRRLLAQHLLSDHEEGPPEDKPFKCSSCEFACRHQLVLEQHLRSHGGKRLYKCTDCEYSTRNKQKITWHIRIHTGEKPYGCERCSYACTDPSRLKVSAQLTAHSLLCVRRKEPYAIRPIIYLQEHQHMSLSQFLY